ncbi:hypothetical protein [Desulfosporosinus sp. SB140]|uniref:hypothetical protein n=1 Tax=Desulfosporosinus paludis TaxID=3115649 RepID=UPI00388CEE4A
MSKLPDNPTAGQVKDFLLEVMDAADDRASKINPSFTKEQIWNAFMSSVFNKDEDKSYMEHQGKASMAVKNMNREFGGI